MHRQKSAKKSSDSIVLVVYNIVKSFILTARSFLFAWCYPKFVETFYNDQVVSFKRDVFASINSVVSFDKTNRQMTILEVGVGPGKRF